MAVRHSVPARALGASRARNTTCVIAGVTWPVYKLEALAAGLLTLLALGLITASAQTAVLTAASVAALVWFAGQWRRPEATHPGED
ncbi:hypothetical protein [Nocardia donostiensis]|uniref:Uncharacterized protein n=1 Tax=Nocardia donostiensis TaxID=1538463 RepID=A0A1V2TBF9_9NOCA|nr:hypothetical protein [Nocardia donostiensis]ONM46845.1 hypothetical protein B0T46_20375 [Nocardia donostiensis]OQS13194.1 hypothetical protein B0T36_20425 [Nocardia donostiensis]OQS19103.1 hypothetical protein B0T44_15675 [Nocardia donostiensis]